MGEGSNLMVHDTVNPELSSCSSPFAPYLRVAEVSGTNHGDIKADTEAGEARFSVNRRGGSDWRQGPK